MKVSRSDQRNDLNRCDERKPIELSGSPSPNFTMTMRISPTSHIPASLIMAEETVCSGHRQFTSCLTRSIPNRAMNKPTHVIGETRRETVGSEGKSAIAGKLDGSRAE